MLIGNSLKTAASSKVRETWVDAVKGFTISLVVFHHVFVGVKNAIGIPEWVVDIYMLTTPIRMPLFFLVAGFYAKKSIFGERRKFIDSKVIHFLYFYILWNTISVLCRVALSKYTNNQVDIYEVFYFLWSPSFTLWFIYALMFAFIIARVSRHFSFVAQILCSLSLSIFSIAKGNELLPYFIAALLKFYPFFLVGIYGSVRVRGWVKNSSAFTPLVCLSLYIAISILILNHGQWLKEVLYYPLAALGACVILTLMYRLNNRRLGKIFTIIGGYSLYIYLIHFFPAAGSRKVSSFLGFGNDPAFTILLGTILSIIFCIIAFKIFANISFLRFLVTRPKLFKQL